MSDPQKTDEFLRGLAEQPDKTTFLATAREMAKSSDPQKKKEIANFLQQAHCFLGFPGQQKLMAELDGDLAEVAEYQLAKGLRALLVADPKTARGCFERALELRTDYANANLALAHLEMMESGFTEGRERYAARLHTAEGISLMPKVDAPFWKGEDVAGRKLYLWAEQGLGDICMFAGFVPWIMKQKPSRVVIAAPPKTMSLLQRSFPGTELLDLEEEKKVTERTDTFDYFIPMAELAMYGIRHYKPAKHGPFLIPDPERVAMVKQSMARLGNTRKIGISWATPNRFSAQIRNIPLSEWIPLLSMTGCHFFSIQHRADLKDIENFNRTSGCRLLADPNFEPFRDTENLAAFIAALDQVITIQNANAHLGGALGTPTTLLLSAAGDYRWPTTTPETSPWYPSLHIIRQKHLMDWSDVMARAENELLNTMKKTCSG